MKIVIIAIVVIMVGIGIAAYLSGSMPSVYAPEIPNPNQDQVVAPTPSPVSSEEQELGAIPVDDLGKEMQDIDAELAK
ncbi:MAG: hypothetical protein WAP52_02695 [Candidatus Sungiibacteriota bacterium]